MTTTADLSTAGAKRSASVTIGTHDGTFHCDEALAIYLLRRLPQYATARFKRTRDQPTLEQCEIVVDVGAVYDPTRHRYDHHQRGFEHTMNSLGLGPWTTKLSSAGLVYAHFGREVIQQLLPTADTSTVDLLYNKMYINFVQEIDAVDNGINQFDGTPRYLVTSTVSQRVGRLNPSWLEEVTVDPDTKFEMASRLVGGEFVQMLEFYFFSWLPARTIVANALSKRHNVNPSGQIIVLERYCPWTQHLFDLEAESDNTFQIIYVLHQDAQKKWRIMTVPVQPGSFQNRKALPEPWRGLRDTELSTKSGIPGGVFVHASGFTGGNETFEGALEMARQSLKF